MLPCAFCTGLLRPRSAHGAAWYAGQTSTADRPARWWHRSSRSSACCSTSAYGRWPQTHRRCGLPC
eukprot:1603761-Lingulodinium_polyedra.AAC.1